MEDEIAALMKANGVCDHGFADFSARQTAWPCDGEDVGLKALPTAVSIVLKLSDAIVNEMSEEPTLSYFHHYRTVNFAIDQVLLKLGLLLQSHGFRYIPIPASQSIPKNEILFSGRFSHREAAVAAGLGSIGRNCLFIHNKAGCGVRLGTLFTNWLSVNGKVFARSLHLSEKCTNCRKCIDVCPAGALIGSDAVSARREDLLIPEKCSVYMKEKFQHIGRGAVCGLCMRHCPQLHS